MTAVSLNTLAEAALLRLPYNHQRFGLAADRYCRAIVERVARYLPGELRDEVVQEAIAQYFETDPEKLVEAAGLTLLRWAVFAAIRTVRASYAPGGERTRWRRHDDKPNRVAAELVGQIAVATDVERAVVIDGDHAHIDFDRFPSPAAASALHDMECAVEAEWALRRAPPNVAVALRLIHLDDVSVEAAATFVGMDRFKLRREVRSLTTLLLAA